MASRVEPTALRSSKRPAATVTISEEDTVRNNCFKCSAVLLCAQSQITDAEGHYINEHSIARARQSNIEIRCERFERRFPASHKDRVAKVSEAQARRDAALRPFKRKKKKKKKYCS